MKLTKEQIKELEDAATPLLNWINDSCHPHIVVIVEYDSIELFDGVAKIINTNYIKD